MMVFQNIKIFLDTVNKHAILLNLLAGPEKVTTTKSLVYNFDVKAKVQKTPDSGD